MARHITTRCRLPLVTLAPVKHGPLPCGERERAGGSGQYPERGRSLGLGHVGTLETLCASLPLVVPGEARIG
jgi:hypothetical protein